MGEPAQFSVERAGVEPVRGWFRLWPQCAAVVAGAVLAVVVSGGSASWLESKIKGPKSMLWSSPDAATPSHDNPADDKQADDKQAKGNPEIINAADGELAIGELDRQKPQRQAEILLERAVSHGDGAVAQIEARINSWQGKLQWDSQLGDLTTVALNSSDQSVRASAIEVQLAAYGLSKNESTLDRLVRQAESSDHAQKIWALWSLGLLGNRGVEAERAVRILSAQSGRSGNQLDEDARRWAVEGLALVGTTSTVTPLLEAMHNDPSAIVRERAACSLAESGMLNHEQRMTAVPKLIDYSEDPALDQQTRTWAFQALKEITRQSLADDSAAWREWYSRSVGSGQ